MNTKTQLEQALLSGEDTAALREQLRQEQHNDTAEQQKAAETQAEAKARVERELQQRAEQDIAAIREQLLNDCKEIAPGFIPENIALPVELLVRVYCDEAKQAEAVAQRAEIQQQIGDIDGRIAALESDKAALAQARRNGTLDEAAIVGRLGLATMDIEDLTGMKTRLTADLEKIQTPPAIERRYFDDAVKQARLQALAAAVNQAETRLVAGAQKLKAEAGTNIFHRWKPGRDVQMACRAGVF